METREPRPNRGSPCLRKIPCSKQRPIGAATRRPSVFRSAHHQALIPAMRSMYACAQCTRLPIEYFVMRQRKHKQKRPLVSGRLLSAETACLLVARELWVMRRKTRHGFNRLQPPKPDFILSLPLLNGAFCRMTSNACTPNKPDPKVIIRTAAVSQHTEHATIG